MFYTNEPNNNEEAKKPLKANLPPQPNIGTNEVNAGALNIGSNAGSTFISTNQNHIEIRNQPDNQGSLSDVVAATPIEENDLATKAYVDAALDGFTIQATCVGATAGHNLNIQSDVENGDSLDGLILFTGQLIIVKDQTDTTQNGVYIVSQENAPTRYPAANMLAGKIFYIEQGTVNHETFWKVAGTFTGPGGEPVYGTDAIAFVPVTITPPSPPAPATDDDEESFSYTLTYNSPATIILGTIGANHSVFGIQVKVTQAFNGSNPILTIGDDTNGPGYLLSNDLTDLSLVNIDDNEQETLYTAATPIKAYFDPAGSTQGTAVIWINIEN